MTFDVEAARRAERREARRGELKYMLSSCQDLHQDLGNEFDVYLVSSWPDYRPALQRRMIEALRFAAVHSRYAKVRKAAQCELAARPPPYKRGPQLRLVVTIGVNNP